MVSLARKGLSKYRGFGAHYPMVIEENSETVSILPILPTKEVRNVHWDGQRTFQKYTTTLVILPTVEPNNRCHELIKGLGNIIPITLVTYGSKTIAV